MFSPVIDDTDRISDTESDRFDDTKDSNDGVEIIDTDTCM